MNASSEYGEIATVLGLDVDDWLDLVDIDIIAVDLLDMLMLSLSEKLTDRGDLDRSLDCVEQILGMMDL